MQSNKYMLNLIVYVVFFIIIVFITGNFIAHYYNSLRTLTDEIDAKSQITKFDLCMLRTIKSNNTIIRKIGTVDDDDSSYFITLQRDDGTTYSFIKQGNILYYNQIKLCENVDFFRVVIDRSGKESISVDITIAGEEYNLQYVIS